MTRRGLLRAELRRDLGRDLWLALVVALGVAAGTLVLALHAGADRLLMIWLPAGDRSLTAESPRVALGGLGAKLDDAMVTELRGLPAVERVVPRMALRVPAMSAYRGAFFGQQLELTIEIAAEGVDEAALLPNLFPGERFAWQPGQPLPVCLSEGLLAIYNTTFAPSRGLPHLDQRLVQGFELPVAIGASMVAPSSPDTQNMTARVVCVSPNAMLAGLTIPLAAVRELNRRHGADSSSYSSLTVIARSADALPTLEHEIEKRGLRLGEGAEETARRWSRLVQVSSLSLLGVVGCLLLLAGALIAEAFGGSLRARARESQLLRALGATDAFLIGQVAAEAAVIGTVGAALGISVAFGLAPAVNHAVLRAGIDLPVPLLAFRWATLLLPMLCGLLAACGGAAIAVLRTRD
jgi:hypothetical protein